MQVLTAALCASQDIAELLQKFEAMVVVTVVDKDDVAGLLM
jgi:hypothetical protein